MEEKTIVIKIKNGDPLLVSKEKLTADSRMFRYLIDELKYDELQMDDFSPEAVSLFLNILEDKRMGEIEDVMFRETHKLAVVFEVAWLKDDCHRWLKSKMDMAEGNQEKSFLFDECWYILKKWEERDTMDALISCLAPKDNTTFISEYMSDIDKLETEQIDLMLKLGGSDTDLFLRTILHNLVGERELSEKVKHLLQKMNLLLCCERNEELYHEVFDTISNLSEISVADMRFIYQMTSETTRLISSRREKKKTKMSVVCDYKKHKDLQDRCKTLNDIIKAASEERVTSMYVVVQLLLKVVYENPPNREETQIFVTTFEDICSEKRLQKISQQYLDMIIAALVYSNLKQTDQLLALLNEIKNNDKLSTYTESVMVQRGRGQQIKAKAREDKESIYQYTFKHPGTGTCTESGKCGFILRTSKRDGDWKIELCTNSEDYADTGIHFHDIISAHEMFWYTAWSNNTAAGNKVTVAGYRWSWWKWWLPDITTDWKFEQECIAYNISAD